MRGCPVGLDVHLCWLLGLLLPLVSSSSRLTASSAGSPTDATSPNDASDTVSFLEHPSGECHFNLTDSRFFLEADSLSSQPRGLQQCQFLVRAPHGRLILLNFTDFGSQPDMLKEPSVQRKHLHQATDLSTPAPITSSSLTPSPSSSTPSSTTSRSLHLSSPGISQELEDATSRGGRDKNGAPTDRLLRKLLRPVNSSPGTEPHALDVPPKIDLNSSLNPNWFTGTGSTDSPEPHNSRQGSSQQDNQRPSVSDQISPPSDLQVNWAAPSTFHGVTPLSPSPAGFSSPNHAELDHSCSLKLIIEEVGGKARSEPRVICWGSGGPSQPLPLLLQYNSPIRITYLRDRLIQTGFSVDFVFLRPDEVKCQFHCNHHLCLRREQLCDGFSDCPDQSDEQSPACVLARQQEDSGDPNIIKVVVIIVSVIAGVSLLLVTCFMINFTRCHHGSLPAGAPLLHPPCSHGSQACQSSVISMSTSDPLGATTLLHPASQRTSISLTSPDSCCLEQTHLLAPHLEQSHHMSPGSEQRHLVTPHLEPRHSLASHSSPAQLRPYFHCSRHNNQPHLMKQPQLPAGLVPVHSPQSPVTCSSPEGHVPLHRLTAQTYGPTLQHQRPLQPPLKQVLLDHKQCYSEQHRQEPKPPSLPAHKLANPSQHYPPHIAVSADGEEGYIVSQRLLHSKQQQQHNWHVENEIFRPPPNKTVFDRYSPPPPYSLKPPGNTSLESVVPRVGVVCVVRHSRHPQVSQAPAAELAECHSLSCHH